MKNSLSNLTFCVHALELPGIVKLTEIRTQFENTGILSKYFLLLQEYLGFKYEITTATGLELMFLAMQNKIHLSVPAIQTVETRQLMDFSQPVSVEKAKFVVGQPAELSKISAIIRPFSIHVWIAIAFSFIISLVIFCIIFRTDAKLNKRKNVKFDEIAWALFGSFTAQGNDLFCPSGKCCRLLVSGWLFATFIITSSYSGYLMSFITFPAREPVPRTFFQLIDMITDGDYKVGVTSIVDAEKFIKQCSGKIGEELKKLLELNKFEEVWLDSNLAKKIVNDKVAFVYFETAIEVFISVYGKEKFLISEDQLFAINAGFGMQKNFPYKKHINQPISRLYETGFIEKLRKDELAEAEKNHQSIFQDNNDHRALNIKDLSGPLLLLMIGYAVSIVIFFLEIIVNKLP